MDVDIMYFKKQGSQSEMCATFGQTVNGEENR